MRASDGSRLFRNRSYNLNSNMIAYLDPDKSADSKQRFWARINCHSHHRNDRHVLPPPIHTTVPQARTEVAR